MKNSCNCPECAADTVENRKDVKMIFIILMVIFVGGALFSHWR